MKLSIIPILFLLLMSCAQEGARRGTRGISSNANAIKTNEKFQAPDEYFKSWVNGINLECGEKECPKYVGVVLIGSGKSKDYCTGFFIEPHVFVTNRHCLAPGTKKGQASCSESISIKTIEQTFQCQRVLKVSSLKSKKELGRDIAFLRVGEKSSYWVKTKKIVIDDKIIDGTIWKVGQNSNLANEFSLESSECEVEKGKSPSEFISSGCMVKIGNSGSPIIDEDGAAIGLIYGFRSNRNSSGVGSLFTSDFWH